MLSHQFFIIFVPVLSGTLLGAELALLAREPCATLGAVFPAVLALYFAADDGGSFHLFRRGFIFRHCGGDFALYFVAEQDGSCAKHFHCAA